MENTKKQQQLPQGDSQNPSAQDKESRDTSFSELPATFEELVKAVVKAPTKKVKQ